MAEEAKTTQQDSARSIGARSIAYPFITLEAALTRVHQFWQGERKNAAPLSSAAKHWDYGEKSSGGRQTVSALLQFGLLMDEGSKENRVVRLTDRAIDLVILPPDDPKRKQLIEAAARSPRIYNELLSKWPELPSDHTLKYFLIKDKNFNPKSVDGFVKDFRSTIRYAEISGPATLPQEELNEAGQKPPAPKVVKKAHVAIGDFVQWTSGGVDQLPLPRRVTSVAADGAFAFVEGTATGLPVEELTVVQQQQHVQQPDTGGVITPQSAGVILRKRATKQDVFSLDEGEVVLQWPDGMSQDSYDDFKTWIDLQLKKIARSVPKG
ncbi:MAG: hypothetical protein ABI843_12330 [Dokdonella sp.]